MNRINFKQNKYRTININNNMHLNQYSFSANILIIHSQLTFQLTSMLIKSTSKSTLFEKDSSLKDKQINIQNLSYSTAIIENSFKYLQEASKLLPHSDFIQFYQHLLKKIISKAEIETFHTQRQYLIFLKKINQTYQCSQEGAVRVGILEVLNEMKTISTGESLLKLQKLKHMAMQSSFEHLLCKILILESKIFEVDSDEKNVFRALKKCLDLNEVNTVHYLKSDLSVRREIVEHMIIAEYELYKLKKQYKPESALQHLHRAYDSATKNYGLDSAITNALYSQYVKEEAHLNSIEKHSSKSKAVTDIWRERQSKHTEVKSLYNWEEEKLVAQLISLKADEVISEITYEIKLDIAKIKMLKCNDWIIVSDDRIAINQDELMRLLGFNQTHKEQTTATKISIKNVNKEAIMKKNSISSSSDDSEFFENQKFKFIKSIGRSQSASKKVIQKLLD